MMKVTFRACGFGTVHGPKFEARSAATPLPQQVESSARKFANRSATEMK